jgi:protein-tyrosine phosphatase
VIDTHCHLLPALDDGPVTRIQSLALAAELVSAGVTFVLCTPHYSRRYPTIHTLAADRLAVLRRDVQDAGLPLRLGLASEISPGFLISKSLEEIAARAIGDRVIVELEPETPVGFLAEAVERLSTQGLHPVFAHPERCRAVRREPQALDEARAEGALTQVVAPSLTGRWGSEIERTAWQLLSSARIDLLASDTHRIPNRGLDIAHASRLVSQRLGEQVFHQLAVDVPATIVKTAERL